MSNLTPVSDGILSEPIDLDGPRHRRPTYPALEARSGVVVEHRSSGVVGAIVSFKPQQIVVRDRFGRDHRIKPRDGAFCVGGKPVALRQPVSTSPSQEAPFTASGSVALDGVPARTALASRIWVEGIHDAELIEKVWGDDLRVEGIVVEQMDGMDDLAERVSRFGPRPGRRLGILLDHLVEGSREWIAAREVIDRDVLITGHPYVDVWQAVRPSAAGIASWPDVPKGTDWKSGVMATFGFAGPAGAFWKQLLGRVESYKDLEQPMINAVERLIDFVADGNDSENFS